MEYRKEVRSGDKEKREIKGKNKCERGKIRRRGDNDKTSRGNNTKKFKNTCKCTQETSNKWEGGRTVGERRRWQERTRTREERRMKERGKAGLNEEAECKGENKEWEDKYMDMRN